MSRVAFGNTIIFNSMPQWLIEKFFANQILYVGEIEYIIDPSLLTFPNFLYMAVEKVKIIHLIRPKFLNDNCIKR